MPRPFTDSPAFRSAVQTFIDEAAVHGWSVDVEAAAAMLDVHLLRTAETLDLTPATLAKRYLSEDVVRRMARETVPAATELGATGRDDEPSVMVPIATVGQLVADLSQAGRLAATHEPPPLSGLVNLITDSLTSIGAALSQPHHQSLSVGGYPLRLARRVLLITIECIDRDGWSLQGLDTSPETLLGLTKAIRESMARLVEELEHLLPPQPPLRVV